MNTEKYKEFALDMLTLIDEYKEDLTPPEVGYCLIEMGMDCLISTTPEILFAFDVAHKGIVNSIEKAKKIRSMNY